jgi:hypothetical protein
LTKHRLRHPAILAILATLALGLGAGRVLAQTPDDVRGLLRDAAAEYGTSADRLIRVVSCETGATFAASAVGDHGTSHGLAQLHSGGLLDSGPSSFYGRGFTNPYDAVQATRYIAWAFSVGLASHWSCR